ncbi:von Willebrand factor A domain-containing protein 5A-like [Protopterus annectens]|uniref:von Willebrand factor A domain-containing protein 5A-like n=1 Tax=Protopterus annectens TaxID=7888 RepID=UPI001CFB6016|nr:von Willebrand factor A domain-containing protein 5A-like [Protopterus annectens]
MAAKLLIKSQPDCMDQYPTLDIIDQITKISIESNVISPYTAYIAVYKDGKEPVQGTMLWQDAPLADFRYMRGGYLQTSCYYKVSPFGCFGYCLEALISFSCCRCTSGHSALSDNKEDQVMVLINLQKADGSWNMDKTLAEIFKSTESEIKSSIPVKKVDPTLWATLLSLIWLHGHGTNVKDDCELLASKAVTWLKSKATVINLKEWMKAGNVFLKTEVEPRQLGL